MNSLSEFADWFAKNPWVIIAGFLIGVVSLILAFVFYIKAKKERIPCYSLWSLNIVRDLVSKIEGLQVSYSGTVVENLTVTKLAFWNAGRETINTHDIATGDPLRIKLLDGTKVLDAKLLYIKNAANKIAIATAEDKSHIALSFEYIDKDEGAVIQFLHNGESSEGIQLQGTIKGAAKLKRKKEPTVNDLSPLEILDTKKNEDGALVTIGAVLFILMLLLGPLAIAGGIMWASDSQWIPQPFRTILAIATVIVLYGGIIYIFRQTLPSGFDVFREKL